MAPSGPDSCSAIVGRGCRVKMKDGTRGAVPIPCMRPAVSVYVREDDGKRIGRCAEHDQVDLANPKNAGWRKEP